ncbi:MAG TPA: PrsW family glutamic-type intramembrane protease [Candidatus Paceibacterota bacterium]|nr:PrsW family glutamic-type intramembrane protease [Candidatus Paceibacterota bacterium]
MFDASLEGYALAIAAGIFPALAWLWFWLKEDSRHPEPRRLIALAFIAGMLTVVIVIPIQKYVVQFLATQTMIFAAWSMIEEFAKYLVAWVTVLHRRENDEPIDAVVYLVAVALGFAGLENALFLLSPLAGDTVAQTVMTGNLRFIGATLLHVFSSAIVGIMLAYSFYKPVLVREWYAAVGVILAALLHSVFNFLILNTADEHLLSTFAGVWIGVIAVLAALEFVKRIRPRLSGR